MNAGKNVTWCCSANNIYYMLYIYYILYPIQCHKSICGYNLTLSIQLFFFFYFLSPLPPNRSNIFLMATKWPRTVIWRDFFIMQTPQKTSQIICDVPMHYFFFSLLVTCSKRKGWKSKEQTLTKPLSPGRWDTGRNYIICNVTKAVQTENQLFCLCTCSWTYLLSYI